MYKLHRLSHDQLVSIMVITKNYISLFQNVHTLRVNCRECILSHRVNYHSKLRQSLLLIMRYCFIGIANSPNVQCEAN